MIKAFLVGYPGSQKIVPASDYLIAKYVVDVSCEIFPIFLNHTGAVENWARALETFFGLLSDELVIFALDDYLVSGKLDVQIYESALRCMESEPVRDTGPVACIKLCHASKEENDAYPVTTQWTIWRREVLLRILAAVWTPWEFEILGSSWFKEHGLRFLHAPALPYFTNSALSGRWEGVRLDGLNAADKRAVKKLISI